MTEYIVEQDFLKIRSKDLKFRTLLDLIKSQRYRQHAKSVVTGIFKTFEEADHHIAEIPLRSYKLPFGYIIHLAVTTIVESDMSGNIISYEDLMLTYRDPESGYDRGYFYGQEYGEVIDEYEIDEVYSNDLQQIIHQHWHYKHTATPEARESHTIPERQTQG